jgi:hypothetical protein
MRGCATISVKRIQFLLVRKFKGIQNRRYYQPGSKLQEKMNSMSIYGITAYFIEMQHFTAGGVLRYDRCWFWRHKVSGAGKPPA